MHLLIGKRQLVLAALVSVLGVAVFLNWYYTGTDTTLSPEGTAPAEQAAPEGAARFTAADAAEEADYFAEARLNREANQAAALEELKAVMASAGETSDAGAAAAEKLSALTDAIKAQSDLETLVQAAVGGECLAVISDNSVDVVVSAAAMRDDTVLRVSDIIRSVCGNGKENIRITAAEAPAAQ